MPSATWKKIAQGHLVGANRKGTAMTDTNLPWSLFNRKLRPFSFAVMLSVTVITWNVITESAVGQLLDGAAGHIVAAVGVLSALLLLGGYVFRNDRVMANGLLFATGVWTTATVVLALDIGAAPATQLAGCWVVACAGSWLLEVSHR